METKVVDAEIFERVGGLWVSPLKVLHSAAGYYLGRTYLDADMGSAELPYDRQSGYFANQYIAQTALDGEYHGEEVQA